MSYDSPRPDAWPPSDPLSFPQQPFPQQPSQPQPSQPQAPWPGGSVSGGMPAYSPAGYSAWTPTPPPPSSPRGVRYFVIWIVVALTAVACSCAGFTGGVAVTDHSTSGGKPAQTEATAPGPVKSHVAAATPSPSPSITHLAPLAKLPNGSGSALKARLIPVPAGAETYPIAGTTGGVMTLSQYVNVWFRGSLNEHTLLQNRGFEVAVQQDWTGLDGINIHMTLVEFTASTGASQFVHGQQTAYSNDSAFPVQYVIKGVPHAAGFENPAFDSDGNHESAIILADGRVVVMMSLYSPGPLDRADAVAVVQRQLDALG